jgi:hypothetical protein
MRENFLLRPFSQIGNTATSQKIVEEQLGILANGENGM